MDPASDDEAKGEFQNVRKRVVCCLVSVWLRGILCNGERADRVSHSAATYGWGETTLLRRALQWAEKVVAGESKRPLCRTTTRVAKLQGHWY